MRPLFCSVIRRSLSLCGDAAKRPDARIWRPAAFPPRSRKEYRIIGRGYGPYGAYGYLCRHMQPTAWRKIHTEILKNTRAARMVPAVSRAFSEQDQRYYPTSLAGFVQSRTVGAVSRSLCGSGWQTDLFLIKGLAQYADDTACTGTVRGS